MISKLKLWHDVDTENWVKKIFDHIDYERCENIQDADYILIPSAFTTNLHSKNIEWLKDIYHRSMDTNKPYIAFLHDDPTEQMINQEVDYTKNGILFRTSFYKSKKSKSEYGLPSFDTEVDVPFVPIEKNFISIGFCGAITHPIRRECISILEKHSAITTKFINRKSFHLRFSQEQRNINKQEFIETMKECPYQLCLRGKGNFSHRFYETLMYGRIPVLVDTDIPLPCEEEINWDNYIVMSKTTLELPSKLIEWHNKYNILEKQRNNRKLWEEYLSPRGFAKYVERLLMENRHI